jgi:hypothetical protein
MTGLTGRVHLMLDGSTGTRCRQLCADVEAIGGCRLFAVKRGVCRLIRGWPRRLSTAWCRARKSNIPSRTTECPVGAYRMALPASGRSFEDAGFWMGDDERPDAAIGITWRMPIALLSGLSA